MSSVSVTEARKSLGGTTVLSGVTLEVPAGSVTALLGRSGSGKTTLLRLVVGLDRLDSGSISIGGELVDDARVHISPRRRRVGYVPQDGALFPHLSVAENVSFGCCLLYTSDAANE